MNSINLNLFRVLVPLFLMTVFALTASADTVVRSGNDVSISEDQTVEGDFYSTAKTVNLSGTVTEDAVIVGGNVSVNGEIKKDALLIGFLTADIHGLIGDDLRVVAPEAIIAEPVAGDLFVVAGKVTILSSATIGGDILIYANEVVIEGDVGGDIIGTVGNMRVDSSVGGNINATVNQLTLGDKANIAGSVSYVSSQIVVRAPGTIIVGDLVRNDPILPETQDQQFGWMLPSLILLFSTAVWYLISRHSLNMVINRALSKSPRPIVLGVITILLAPFAAGMLLISMIGSVVGIALIFAYTLMILLSIIGLVAVFGQILMFAFSKKLDKHASLLSILIGGVGLILLAMLPTVGLAVMIFLVVLTFGAMVDILLKPGSDT